MIRHRFCGIAEAAILLGSTSPALAQSLGGAQAPDVSMLRVAAALVLCIAVAVAGAYVLRFKMTGRLDFPTFAAGSARRLILLERLRLGADHELCLIAFEGHEFLVSVSPAGIVRFDANAENGAVATS